MSDDQLQEDTPTSKARFNPWSQEDMGWLEHLEELRDRLMIAALAWLVGTVICYFFSQQIMEFLKAPLMEVLPTEDQKLYFTGIFENFLIHLKIAGYGGIILAAPVILIQVWKFISPGLYPKERKLVVPFVVAGTFFFLAGVFFSYLVVFPAAFQFLLNFGQDPDTVPIITLGNYFSAALRLMFVFGLAFELPVVLILLGALGVLHSEILAKNRRWAIMIMAIACAFLSPPDFFSMIFMMVPIYFFYEASIMVMRLIEKSRASKQSSE